MIEKLVEATKRFLHRRRYAYQRVFDSDNVYTDEVLRDLAWFCRAHVPTYHADPRVHAELEGRREVWLRIQNHLQFDDEKLWKLYGRKDLE